MILQHHLAGTCPSSVHDPERLSAKMEMTSDIVGDRQPVGKMNVPLVSGVRTWAAICRAMNPRLRLFVQWQIFTVV